MANTVESSLRRPQLGVPRLSFGFQWFATQGDHNLSRVNAASFMHEDLFHHSARCRSD